MEYFPDADAFCTRHEQGLAQLLWCCCAADLETPVSAWLKLTREPYEGEASSQESSQKRRACLFESVEGGRHRGRYSILALAPDLLVRAVGGQIEVCRAGEKPSNKAREVFVPYAKNGIAGLRALWAESRIEPVDCPQDFPPMSSGLFGYMGFETVRLFEDIGEQKACPLRMPEWFFIRPALTAIFDSLKSCVWLVASSHASLDRKRSATQAYSLAKSLLEEGLARLLAPLTEPLTKSLSKSLTKPSDWQSLVSSPSPRSPSPRPVSSTTTRSDFLSSVARAKEHIAAGDCFQIVLSQRFSCPFESDPFAYYRALRRVNPSPYLYFLDFGEDGIVAGSSPETLVRVSGDKVVVRPLAGTRPRGASDAEDWALEQELLADEKERAEHLMLIDLGRNDVGRVARAGSVRLTERFGIERYSQVMHIVSHVEGILARDKDALDALVAGFPAGTVSGAPKVRAMQIITALEPHARGLYAGGIGWLGSNGDLDTCIALRTAVVRGGRLHVQVGAGIVADSVAEREFEECENKARALFKAAEMVQ